MSYCRFSDKCDIYCYAHVNGGFAIHVNDGRDFSDESATECANRLEILRKEGLKVSQHAIDRLRSEEKNA